MYASVLTQKLIQKVQINIQNHQIKILGSNMESYSDVNKIA